VVTAILAGIWMKELTFLPGTKLMFPESSHFFFCEYFLSHLS